MTAPTCRYTADGRVPECGDPATRLVSYLDPSGVSDVEMCAEHARAEEGRTIVDTEVEVRFLPSESATSVDSAVRLDHPDRVATDTATAVAKHGVFWEDNAWVGYVDGRMVAAGPTQSIVEAAQRFHAEGGEDDADLDAELAYGLMKEEATSSDTYEPGEDGP